MIGVHSRAAVMKSLLRFIIFIKSSVFLDSRAARQVATGPRFHFLELPDCGLHKK
jgi:hypothetical protein